MKIQENMYIRCNSYISIIKSIQLLLVVCIKEEADEERLQQEQWIASGYNVPSTSHHAIMPRVS